jgi:hypothetical protein
MDETVIPETDAQEPLPREEEPLSLDEATQAAEMIVRGWRGFAKAGRVLKVAQTIQGQLQARLHTLHELDAQVLTQTAHLQAVTQQVTDAEQAHRATLERLTEELRQAEQAHAAALRGLADERRQIEAERDSARQQHEATLAQYTAAEVAAQRAVRTAEHELEKLKRQTLARLGMA